MVAVFLGCLSFWTATPPTNLGYYNGLLIILTKMLAYRPQDIADIETLLVSNPGLDTELIRREWALFTSNDPSRTAWLNDALRRLQSTP